MKVNPEEEFNELLKIEDKEDRMTVASSKFKDGLISAKSIRRYFETLDTKDRSKLLDYLYGTHDKKTIRQNMDRLPPSILIPNCSKIVMPEDIILLEKVLGFELVNKYEKSKTQQKFYRFKNIVKSFLNSKLEIDNSHSNCRYSVRDIRRSAISNFIEILMKEQRENDISPLGLPSSMTIGVELEYVGVGYYEVKEIRNFLEEYFINYLNDFRIKPDNSVIEGAKFGAEIVSPILQDTEDDWIKLKEVCDFLQAIGGKTNKTCGGHIHIGENTMGVDKEAWKTFLSVWSEAEPLIYILSNRKGENTRNGANRYAAETSFYIDRINWSEIKIRDENDVIRLAKKVSQNDRYKALNLINIVNGKKNTIEFRLSNGTLDYSILRENILLYGRLIQMAKMHSVDPSRKKEQLDRFFEKDISQEEKLNRFLNLVFDDEEEKRIFYRRWESKAKNETIQSVQDYIPGNDEQEEYEL